VSQTGTITRQAIGVVAVALLLTSGASAAPSRASAPAPGIAASVEGAGPTVRLWRDGASGEVALLRAGSASVTRILGTTLRETSPGDGGRLVVDRYPSRRAALRIVELRFGLSGAAIEAALARGQPAPPPVAVIASRRAARRASSVDLHLHFGTNVRALATASRTAVAWIGHRALGLPLREASLLSSTTPQGGSSGRLALLLYSDDGADPGAADARILTIQGAPATSLGGRRLGVYLRGRGPNPRLGGAVARRITRGEVVLRIGPVVALLTLPQLLTDAQLGALLGTARLVRPGG
jgi:hypothetical protein